MKKVVFGFAAGVLFAEAVIQLAWITGEWDNATKAVDERLSRTKFQSMLRRKFEELIEESKRYENTYNVENLERLMSSVGNLEAQRRRSGLPRST